MDLSAKIFVLKYLCHYCKKPIEILRTTLILFFFNFNGFFSYILVFLYKIEKILSKLVRITSLFNSLGLLTLNLRRNQWEKMVKTRVMGVCSTRTRFLGKSRLEKGYNFIEYFHDQGLSF